MSLKSDNILFNTSKLLNTYDDAYAIQKLKCAVSDNTTSKIKYHNYTRPRHKIFLEGDTLSPINSNNAINFNYIISVYNKYYMNTAITSQSPFDFYNTINIFKKQIDFIDHKSLHQNNINSKLLNKTTIKNNYTLINNLSFYKYFRLEYLNNNNFKYSNVAFGNNSLSGNYYEVYKNINFNY